MLNYYIINETCQNDPQLIGSGLEKCLILISKEEYNNSLEKLEQILKAVGLDKKKDVVICLLEENNFNQSLKVIPEFGIVNVISFGPQIFRVFPNIQEDYYQIINTESYNWLSAPLLSDIISNSGEKMKLWKALQSMFKRTK